MISLENEADFQPDFDIVEIAQKVINYVLMKEKCPYETEVSVVITTNDEIWKVNKEFRNIDSPTDVLSFPANDFETPADFSEFTDCKDCEHFNQENGCFILGDIMISAQRIVSQAEEYGHSQLREYAFLLTHSILHLIGYDHMTIEEMGIMEKKQSTYLDELQIQR